MRICKYFNKFKRDGKYQRFITQNCESSSKAFSLMILLEGKYQCPFPIRMETPGSIAFPKGLERSHGAPT